MSSSIRVNIIKLFPSYLTLDSSEIRHYRIYTNTIDFGKIPSYTIFFLTAKILIEFTVSSTITII